MHTFLAMPQICSFSNLFKNSFLSLTFAAIAQVSLKTLFLGLKNKPLALMKKLRKAKKEAPPMEKPAVVKTHLR